ncbi:phosphonate C-P lyase system protein PhnG [Oscillochloris sp. ZM17-4]|uniref:phosphonate C-P lyase system protein PhnG n=1 Tax=Oscillochloris sp. ZM17-4 TaxID=2866714 RepID=UPI001C73D429|nr:phosphonate C-P lyase system protein PhnG [Oscillochloris sp. ZM17-4]MBX0329386.1 phosphonate C-P lyase system protein PhnG [Oscillochloris sp. ZM17-4]
MDQHTLLSTLARADSGAVKAFVEDLIPALEPITVRENRTGLAMLPMEETVRDEAFYLGEVLIAEARVRAGGAEGYAACMGRDLELALAIALLDAANAGGVELGRVEAFVEAQAAALAAEDEALGQQVERTRVELETF